MGVKYASRESLMRTPDVRLSARMAPQIDRALERASRNVEKSICHRVFYPVTATRSFDWPDRQSPISWRLWLNENDLISATTITASGVVLAVNEFILRAGNGADDTPPYESIEIRRDMGATFGGATTPQRAVSVSGIWGYADDSEPAGNILTGMNASVTSILVSDGATIGVGDLITVGTERMLVSGRALTSTGQTLQTPVGANNNENTIAVTGGTAFQLNETILLDAERMLITDIVGNNLVVRRATDGSTLAGHTGSTVYAPLTLTLVRGYAGTTAATHTNGDAITRYVPPASISALVLAVAMDQVLQETAGYGRMIGSGENERESSRRGITQLTKEVRADYGRNLRTYAV